MENRFPSNGEYWIVSDMDKLPLDMVFSPQEIREKREELKKAIRKSVDKIGK